MRRDFGKLNGGAITYAPNAINNDFNAPASAYLAAGWKILHLDEPTNPAPAGSHYEADGFDETDTEITQKWRTVEDAPVYRQWTPLSIKRACGDKWANVKAALETAGIYDEFLMAQYLSEDDPSFVQGYEWACQQYGKEAVDAILDAAEVE